MFFFVFFRPLPWCFLTFSHFLVILSLFVSCRISLCRISVCRISVCRIFLCRICLCIISLCRISLCRISNVVFLATSETNTPAERNGTTYNNIKKSTFWINQVRKRAGSWPDSAGFGIRQPAQPDCPKRQSFDRNFTQLRIGSAWTGKRKRQSLGSSIFSCIKTERSHYSNTSFNRLKQEPLVT